jgi:hypothetical protein
MNNSPAKRYTLEFSASMTSYVVVLAGSLAALNAVGGGSPWRWPLALLPVLPGAAALIAFVRRLRAMDELERRIQFEAFGAVCAVTVLVTLTYGFLENAGLPRVSAIWITPLMIGMWGMASAAVSRRYA